MLDVDALEGVCLSAVDSALGLASICSNGSRQLVRGIDLSMDFETCLFDADCFHSTAAAVISSGRTIPTEDFSFEILSRLPAWNITAQLSSETVRLVSSDRAEAFYPYADEVQDAPTLDRISFPSILMKPDEFPFYGEFESIHTELRAQRLPITVAQVERMRDELLGSPEFAGSLQRARQSMTSLATALADLDSLRLAVTSNEDADFFERLQELRPNLEEVLALSGHDMAEQLWKVQYTIEGLQKRASSLTDASSWAPIFSRIPDAAQEIETLQSFAERASQLRYSKDEIQSIEGLLNLPQRAFPLAATYSIELNTAGLPGLVYQPAYVNRNMIVRRGRRGGGPIISAAVFSEVDSEDICALFDRLAPCVLTDLGVQARALEFLQTQIEALDNGRSSIGAILMIAGGELSRTPCDDTATAALISALKERGVFTFVPVGNDGDPTAVRFPACASDAIAIGATDRTGTPLAESNGGRTNMVDLWMDGDGLVIPMHGPELVDIPGCLFAEGFRTTFETVQSKLKEYGFDPGSIDGLPSPQTEQAVRAFQTRYAVELGGDLADPPGTLGQGTLSLLLNGGGVSRNVSESDVAALEDYRGFLCAQNTPGLDHHPYFVGGTLVSASLAAGHYLSLLDDFPAAPPEAVLNAMLSPSSKLVSFSEFEAVRSVLEDG